MQDPRSILITGASSGIGAALARAYAGPGVTLFLGGRHPGKRAAVERDCRAAGAEVVGASIDVTDAETCRRWVEESDRRRPLDLVIANAGISAGTGGAGEPEDQTRRIFATNVDGVMNTVLPAIPAMKTRGRGQIAIMASLASFLGLPGAPAYCASKAAIRYWGEALHGALHADGIAVSVICPGYVRTPMTDANDFPMPLLMDAERSARIIRRGLARGRMRIAFPLPMYALVRLTAALPSGLTSRLMRELPKKGLERA